MGCNDYLLTTNKTEFQQSQLVNGILTAPAVMSSFWTLPHPALSEDCRQGSCMCGCECSSIDWSIYWL